MDKKIWSQESKGKSKVSAVSSMKRKAENEGIIKPKLEKQKTTANKREKNDEFSLITNKC